MRVPSASIRRVMAVNLWRITSGCGGRKPVQCCTRSYWQEEDSQDNKVIGAVPCLPGRRQVRALRHCVPIAYLEAEAKTNIGT
jgi:hypothetical protein